MLFIKEKKIPLHCLFFPSSPPEHYPSGCWLTLWLTFHGEDEVVSGMVKGSFGLARVHPRVLAMHLHHLQHPHFLLVYTVVAVVTAFVVIVVVVNGVVLGGEGIWGGTLIMISTLVIKMLIKKKKRKTDTSILYFYYCDMKMKNIHIRFTHSMK